MMMLLNGLLDTADVAEPSGEPVMKKQNPDETDTQDTDTQDTDTEDTYDTQDTDTQDPDDLDQDGDGYSVTMVTVTILIWR